MLSAQYPFGRPEDTNLKLARQMHNMLQVRTHFLCGRDSMIQCCHTTRPAVIVLAAAVDEQRTVSLQLS